MNKNLVYFIVSIFVLWVTLGVCRIVQLKDVADPVSQAISNIGDVTLEDEETITKVQEMYDNLPKAAKPYVKNYADVDKAKQTIDEIKVNYCIELISQLEVDDSSEKIEEAENYYNALSDENKEKVTNLYALNDAKERLEKRKEQAAAFKRMEFYRSVM